MKLDISNKLKDSIQPLMVIKKIQAAPKNMMDSFSIFVLY
jgi:hypothetical protein